MRFRLRQPSLAIAFAAVPALTLGYAGIAYLIVVVGCLPQFADVDFFDVPVTDFLILALTAATLVLIALAAHSLWHVVWRPAKSGESIQRPLAAALLGFTIAAAGAAITAWLARALLHVPCT